MTATQLVDELKVSFAAVLTNFFCMCAFMKCVTITLFNSDPVIDVFPCTVVVNSSY